MKRRRLAAAALVVAVAAGGWHFARPHLRPAIAPPDAATLAQARNVRILRDSYGVPHVFGKSDGDAAFGLAYAHAEDDFPLIQGVLAASRGKLATVVLSKQAIINDYYTRLVAVPEAVAAEYGGLAADVREVMESYARGLNYYAYRHPGEVDTRLLPYSGRDIAAGFAHKIPLMLDLPGVLQALDGDHAPRVGDRLAVRAAEARAFPASNSHAVAGFRASDGITRLNVNSHQPWEGPVTWYEAQVVSEQGWNMTGGLFPGAPVVLHGHNQHLGWAHTVNAPDLVDVYQLEMNPANSNEYKYDGKWRALERFEAPLEIDTGLFELTIHKEVLRSVHGPVLHTKNGFYAIRYAGWDRRVRAVEQWYRMNKATDLASWKAAMAIQAIPMFNTTYADRDHIYYVYNALLPDRSGADADYRTVLPGDRPELIWQRYLPFEKLPQVLDPPSGFVQNCNGTPFHTTTGDANPRPGDFPAAAGIETVVNNRTARSLELFGGTQKISADDFLRFKWDRTYSRESPMFRQVVAPLTTGPAPADPDAARAVELLRGWDGVADEGSPAATLAILTWTKMQHDEGGPRVPDAAEALRQSLAILKNKYGRIDVPLGTVQRLRRGAVDLPLGGGPDVLNAAHSHLVDGHLVGYQGDSYILFVAFGPDGPTSQSVHQYGDCNRPDSPHYADQAPLFVRRQLRPAWRTEADIRAHLEREYQP